MLTLTMNLDIRGIGNQVASPPLILLHDNTPAVFDKVVVREHQEVSEDSGACPCSHGSGNEVFQRSVKSEGGKQVLLIHLETSCIVCMCDQGRRGEGEGEGVKCR